MAFSKVILFGETLMDDTQNTVTESTLLPGFRANGANGEPVYGEFEEEDPTVPEWAKAGQKPAYTAEEIGAMPATAVISSQEIDDILSRLAPGIGPDEGVADYTLIAVPVISSFEIDAIIGSIS